MALGEFALIERYFSGAKPAGILGVGDDAAVMGVAPDHQLVVCKDLMVQGRHFFADVEPASLGHKSLAVNLSDLAAMGARPSACLLGLGLPSIDQEWVSEFSRGFVALCERWNCPLIGGDTVSTSGDIFISVTALGTLPPGTQDLRRSAARVGDDLWVSGYLGAASVALEILFGHVSASQQTLQSLRSALEWPEPRVTLGQRLLGLAHAAIDISDGLTQDLGHVLKASNVGAVVWPDQLPVDPQLAGFYPELVRRAVLQGGDVYELCFCAPASNRLAIEELGRDLKIKLTRVGEIIEGKDLLLQSADGIRSVVQPKGFDHFGEQP